MNKKKQIEKLKNKVFFMNEHLNELQEVYETTRKNKRRKKKNLEKVTIVIGSILWFLLVISVVKIAFFN